MSQGLTDSAPSPGFVKLRLSAPAPEETGVTRGPTVTQSGPSSGPRDSEAIAPSTPNNSPAGGASALTASAVEGVELTLGLGQSDPIIQVPTHKTKLPPVTSGITLNCGFLKHRFCFQTLSSIRDESELTNFEIKMAEHSEDITELVNVLMTLEMQLVEQLEVRWGPGNTRDATALPGSCARTWRGNTFPGATRRVTRKLSVLLVLFSR